MSGDPGTGTQTFTYDALNRVTGSAGLAAANRAYTYDRDGNRRTKTEGGVTFTYTLDRTDELVSVTKGILTPQAFTYDARGNLTGDSQTGTDTTAYTYDLGNRLTRIDAPNTANDADFTLDALGRFATRVLAAGSGTDTYSYTGTTETVARIANSLGTVTESITTPAGDRLGVKVGTTTNWFLPDLHGDIAGSLSSDQATVVNAIRYDAWGETIATGSAGGTAVGAATWKYQGRLDLSPTASGPTASGTPLYDMSARLYAPGIGTFTQLDTVAGGAQHPLSMNRFLYAEANPATLVDPTGHCPGFALWLGGPVLGFVGSGVCVVGLIAAGLGAATVVSVSGVNYCLGAGPLEAPRCQMPDLPEFERPATVVPPPPLTVPIDYGTDWDTGLTTTTPRPLEKPFGENPDVVGGARDLERTGNPWTSDPHERGGGGPGCGRACVGGVAAAVAALVGVVTGTGVQPDDDPPTFKPTPHPTPTPQPAYCSHVPFACPTPQPQGPFIAPPASGKVGGTLRNAPTQKSTPVQTRPRTVLPMPRWAKYAL